MPRYSPMMTRLKLHQQIAPRNQEIGNTLVAVTAWTGLDVPPAVADPIARAKALLEQAQAELDAALAAVDNDATWER